MAWLVSSATEFAESQKKKVGPKEDPFDNLSIFHFQVKTWLTVIPTGLYQYTIFMLIVQIFYKISMMKGNEQNPPIVIQIHQKYPDGTEISVSQSPDDNISAVNAGYIMTD